MGNYSSGPKTRNHGEVPQGSVYRDEDDFLTPNRSAILGYLQQGLTISQIADRMGVSPTYARRVRRELEGAGLYSRRSNTMENKEVPFLGGSAEPAEPRNRYSPMEKKRFHALQWRIPIASHGPRFRPNTGQRLASGSAVQVVGDKFLLVSAPPGASFNGVSTDDAVLRALAWLERLMRRVESDLDVVLVKDRKVWELVKCELADMGAPEAAPVHRDGHRKIFDPVDGKLRISYDKSVGVAEREVHHRQHWYADDAGLDKHLLALAGYASGPTLPELASVTEQLSSALRSQIEITNVLLSRLVPPDLPEPDGVADYYG